MRGRLFFATVSIAGLVWSGVATAAQGGLVVSPAIEQLTASPGQSSLSFQATVTNNSSTPVILAVHTDDFSAQGASGSPVFLNNLSRAASPHGLVHWMTVSPTVTTLQPGATTTVTVVIDGLATMGPGGHYGAVLFESAPQPNAATGNYVGSSAGVSTLVFLTTQSGATRAVSLANPVWDSFYITLPSSVNLLLTNTGNTQTAPRGIATVMYGSGSEAARGIINTDSGLVLPGTSRLYQVTLRQEGALLWPALSHLNIRYRADEGKVMTYTTTFLYIGPVASAAMALAVLSLLTLVIYRLRQWTVRYRVRSK